MTKQRFGNICLASVCVLTACVLGCASNAMERVSARFAESVEECYGDVMQGPMLFRTRMNACDCDSALIYEAEIYGSFRHIKVDREIPGLETGIREVCYGQTGRYYESGHGQIFYEFEVLPEESCIR